MAAARPAAPTSGHSPSERISSLSNLVASRSAEVAAETQARSATVQRLTETRRAEDAALARADLLAEAQLVAQRAARAARNDVGSLAAAFYRGASRPAGVASLFESRSVTEFGYRQKIVSEVGNRQTRALLRALKVQRAAERAARNAGDEHVRLHQLALSLRNEIPRRDARIGELQAGVSRARFWLSRWQSISAGVNTPIMSRSIIGPSELARWFTATHRRSARITVPIATLAQYFIEEGQAAQVRGDIAFAQSILETGAFYFPDGGQLTPTDNNFAGINACDSCATGSAFPSAQIGVRAQMQLLRVYADANLTNAQLNPPPVYAKLDSHFLKGRVTTWNGLTHTWATADRYGDRILDIYGEILGWLTDQANI
ncbi:MAG: glucosaminidase domain-containing protein [Acidimicrobiia bacterium]|nr:glucosaminidase domain-containing protein [Acidimicrobiia bacterium]